MDAQFVTLAIIGLLTFLLLYKQYRWSTKKPFIEILELQPWKIMLERNKDVVVSYLRFSIFNPSTSPRSFSFVLRRKRSFRYFYVKTRLKYKENIANYSKKGPPYNIPSKEPIELQIDFNEDNYKNLIGEKLVLTAIDLRKQKTKKVFTYELVNIKNIYSN